MSDIKLNESLTSDDNMGENDFFQNINNIVNLNSDDSNINNSPMPTPMILNMQTQPVQTVQTQPVQTVQRPPIQTQPKQVMQRPPIQTQPKQVMQRPPIQTQPKQPVQNIQTVQTGQTVQTQQRPPIQTQPKPIQTQPVQTQPIQTQPVQTQPVQTVPQLSEKLVTFNDVVEQKEITPTSQQAETEIKIHTENLLTEIKKIKIGKLLVPKVTVLFVLVLIVIGAGLFYATKPKKLEDKKDNT